MARPHSTLTLEQRFWSAIDITPVPHGFGRYRQQDIADMMGVSRSAVNQVLRRKLWGWLE
jgi:transcriptional regulator with XRE-family HTH domain